MFQNQKTPAQKGMILHGAIDDATGAGLALYLRPTEDLHGYVAVLEQLCTRDGLPLAPYGDRLNVFVRNDQRAIFGHAQTRLLST